MFRAFESDNIHIDAVDEQGRTSLLIAATFDHYGTCNELLQYGANPDISDNEGWTPLAAACRYGNISILILLLDYGADRSLRATGGPWHMDHLVVHGNACQDTDKRDKVLSILRGHRIAESWLEIIDSHWRSIGGRPDYDEMINNTNEFLRKYTEKIQREEKEEQERLAESKKLNKEKKELDNVSSLGLTGPWHLEVESVEWRMSEGVLRNVFDSMLKSPNESKSRHFIQQIPVKEKPSLKKKRTKKGRKQTKVEDDEVPEQDIAEQVITKDQLFYSLQFDKNVILNIAKFSAFKPILRIELFDNLYERLITRTQGLLNYSEFLQFLEYGDREGENRLLLRRLFDAIDVDKSGTIDKMELLTAFNNNQDVVSLLQRKPELSILLRPDLFEEAFIQMDTDETGTVSYEEFVHFVTVSRQTATHRAKLREIFDIIDSHGDKTITKRSILKAFTVNNKIIKL